MNWLSAVSDIVDRYIGGNPADSAEATTHEDFQNVAHSAPEGVVADGIAHMFRSDETPAFSEMISSLFSESNQSQKVGLLDHLLSALGPGSLAALPGLGGLTASLGGNGDTAERLAGKLSPQQVEQIATHAERQDPSIVDKVSGFYAQHPGLMKAGGGMALSVAMKHMMKRGQ
jgi:hypothetical protein